MEVAERLHQVRHGRVAGAMLVLRLGNAAIDQHLHVARQAPDEIAHRQRRGGKARLVDVTDHQRPGVDERVTWTTAFELQLYQRVEWLPGRLMPQPLPDRFAGMLDRLHQAEDLGYALHRERCL